MEVTGFELRAGVIGMLSLVFYRLLDEATVVGVEELVVLVEGSVARAEISYSVCSVMTGLCLTLSDASSRC